MQVPLEALDGCLVATQRANDLCPRGPDRFTQGPALVGQFHPQVTLVVRKAGGQGNRETLDVRSHQRDDP